MFENVYFSSAVKCNEELEKVRALLEFLYDYHMESPSNLPLEFAVLIEEYGLAEIVKDHIASMTDRYAVDLYMSLVIPNGWKQK